MTTELLSAGVRTILRWKRGEHVEQADHLAVEEPLEIRIASPGGQPKPLAVTMRTPGDDRDLAAGFCLTEGIVTRYDQIARIAQCDEADYGNVVTITLRDRGCDDDRTNDACSTAERRFYLSSSCGLCGKESIDRIEQAMNPITSDWQCPIQSLTELPRAMRQAQETFDDTGGLHAAAIFDREGKLIVLREDVGRHNAVDKVIGYMMSLGRMPIDQNVLLVSGRTSFEIMQKAGVAGIAVIAAVGAPSTLAADFAERVGQTLIGFLSDQRMNIYTHPQRIQL